MILYENGKICNPLEDYEVYGSYDVVVVGGGMAGVAAALSCGKRGWKVLLIEALSALGGLATMGLVNIPLDFVSGLGTEMFRELEAENGLWHRNTDVEKHKLVLDRMLARYHCEVLLVTPVVDAIVEGDTIRGVVIQTKQGRRAVYARGVIDCSGDSDAAYYAGAELLCGRPGDGMSQACSLEFILGGVDWDAYAASDLKKNDPRWVARIREDLTAGKLPYATDNHLNWITHVPGRPQHCGMDEVSICFAHSRRCYPADNRDLTRMYLEGREQANMLARYIRENIPGFEHSFLTVTAPLLGVRESRRILGEYVLTAKDLATLAKQDDVVCMSNHGYDIHNFEDMGNIKWAPIEIDGETRYVICNAGGFGTTTRPPHGAPVVNIKGQSVDHAEFDAGGCYDIPYRCLVPVRVENLLAAGRNLSADIHAQSGARLVMACFTMGEAAGTAMSIALKKGVTPRQVERVELQRELVASGVNIGQRMRRIPGLERQEGEADGDYRNGEFIAEKHVAPVQKDTLEFVRGEE